MKKILILLVAILAYARLNPFVPVVTNENNNIIKKTPFNKKTLKLPSDARILKSVIIKYQALNGSIKKIEFPINKAIDWHNPLILSTKKISLPIKKVKISFVTFYIKNHKVLIQTKDKMIRHFILAKPFRYVIDFQANKNFLTYSKNINSFIKKVVLGNHNGFYRIVLYLDGTYKITPKKTDEGYLLEFR